MPYSVHVVRDDEWYCSEHEHAGHSVMVVHPRFDNKTEHSEDDLDYLDNSFGLDCIRSWSLDDVHFGTHNEDHNNVEALPPIESLEELPPIEEELPPIESLEELPPIEEELPPIESLEAMSIGSDWDRMVHNVWAECVDT
eukprot:745883_1